MVQFQSEYLNSPTHNPLWDIGMEYHCRTEVFDQARCRYKNERGIAIPCESSELKDCSDNARRVRRNIMDKYAIDHQQFQQAIRMTAAKFEADSANLLRTTAALRKPDENTMLSYRPA